MLERPQARPRKPPPREPVPAADEDIDPIVPSSPEASAASVAVKYQLPVEVPRRRRGTPVVQVNVRLPEELDALIDRVADSTVATKSEVVEAALRFAYEKQGQ